MSNNSILVNSNQTALISFKHLSIKEIEERIEHIKKRVLDFEGLISAIKNPISAIPLKTQVENYNSTLEVLEEELRKRIRKT